MKFQKVYAWFDWMIPISRIVQQRCVYCVELEPIVSGYCHPRYFNLLLNVQNEIFPGSIGFSFEFSQEMIIQLNEIF